MTVKTMLTWKRPKTRALQAWVNWSSTAVLHGWRLLYRASVGRLMELVVEIGTECAKLKASFQDDYAFGVDIYFDGSQQHANVETAEYLEDRMRRAAWGVLINKLGIRKIMSSKRQDELDLEYPRRAPVGITHRFATARDQ